MQLDDLVRVVMAQEKVSALSAEVLKKQLMANRIMQRCIGEGTANFPGEGRSEKEKIY